MAHDLFHHPLDIAAIARKRKALREELLGDGRFVDVRIAILGGSTTNDVQDFLELFLLESGIRPTFHVSLHDRWYEEATVDDQALRAFAPDVVFVHTTQRNLDPRLDDATLDGERKRFAELWRHVLSWSECLLVQNNFDPPPLEPLGHLGATTRGSRTRLIARLNEAFAAFAEASPRLRIVDLHALAAQAGLDAWTSERHWHHYRMALTVEGSARVAHAVARIVAAAFGKSKKCLVLDLDDTLWGGVVGEDGVDGIEVGADTPLGEAHLAFQRYCRGLRERGVILAVCSKNDEAVARSAFRRRECVLRPDDFAAFVASWEPKPDGLRAIAKRLGIGLDAMVFVDDNPAERELVRRELPEVAVANVGDVTTFAAVLDRERWFEPFSLGAEDVDRTAYYAANAAREASATRFVDYGEYLRSLEMVAEIRPFTEADIERLAQLANKTNQFNLTTRRYTSAQLRAIATNAEYLTLSGRLRDRFGDNGLVTAVVGRKREAEVHVELWIMSCRVLKRDLELAMFDALVERARSEGLRAIVGEYRATAKNGLVADHYRALGFAPVAEEEGNVWRLALDGAHVPRNRTIRRTHEDDPGTHAASLS